VVLFLPSIFALELLDQLDNDGDLVQQIIVRLHGYVLFQGLESGKLEDEGRQLSES
jgi:hypothetical protein